MNLSDNCWNKVFLFIDLVLFHYLTLKYRVNINNKKANWPLAEYN